MKPEGLKLFAKLMEKGYITREQEPTYYEYYNDPEIASEALRAAISGHLVLSTIHASTVTDAIQSIVKYAAATGISEEMAFDLVGNGILAVLHQTLVGVPKRAKLEYVFANPDPTQGDQVRGIVKSGKMNLSTTIESQRIRLSRGISLWDK